MHLDIKRWNSFATRKGKEGLGVLTFDDEIGVKVLWRALNQIASIYSNWMQQNLQGLEIGLDFGISRS
jgi:hypothetical protein